MIIRGEEYEIVRSSDLVRDGMHLEAWDAGGEHVADVFWSDQDERFSFSVHRHEVPLELVEYLAAEARRLLPPEGHPGSKWKEANGT